MFLYVLNLTEFFIRKTNTDFNSFINLCRNENLNEPSSAFCCSLAKCSDGKIGNINSIVYVCVFLSHLAHPHVLVCCVDRLEVFLCLWLLLWFDNIVQCHSHSDMASLEGREVRQSYVFKIMQDVVKPVSSGVKRCYHQIRDHSV